GAELAHRRAGLAGHAADHEDDAAALRIVLVELVAGINAELAGETRVDDDEHLLALTGEAVGEAEQRQVGELAVVLGDEVPAAILIAAVAGKEDDEEIAGLARGAEAVEFG